MLDSLQKRRRGYVRNGKVTVMPIKRTSDWLPENSDSAFMNTGAKVEYVVPRLQRSGQLVDPLADLTDEQKDVVARQLGYKTGDDLNIMKPNKENFWINKPVLIDKNGKHLDLSNVADFINYKILEVNLDFIAPTWEERYNKGTYKFALVFEEEESKLKNTKLDTKKEAYMLFGKIDGSAKKLSDVLWIYYLTNKEAKRLPNNPSMEYLRGEVGRLIEEKPGEFLSIVTDPLFETKALIQKSINIGLIQRDGMMFKIFGEDTSKNTLDGLISYLQDERNNNIRISLIGKIEQNETTAINPLRPEKIETRSEPVMSAEELKELQELREKNQQLQQELNKEKKPKGRKPNVTKQV